MVPKPFLVDIIKLHFGEIGHNGPKGVQLG